MSVFSERLKEARTEAKMTVTELGFRSGYSNTYIGNLMAERRPTPSPYVIARLAKALSVPYTQLMPDDGHLIIDGNEKQNRGMERSPVNVKYNLKTERPGPKVPQLPKKLFGEYLKQARIAAGISVDKISNKLNITSKTILRYESGEAEATLFTLKYLEKHYGLRQYELTDRAGFLIRDDDDVETVEPPKPEPAPQPGTIRVVSNLMDWLEVPEAKTHPANPDPNDICAELLEELVRARTKHPKSFNSAHEGYAILKEEVEELWEDIKQDKFEHARKELIQVGAMAIRFLLDVNFNEKPKTILAKIVPTPAPAEEPPKKRWFGRS